MDEKNIKRYQALYKHSIEAPETFWAEQAEKYITWFKKWDTVLTGDIAHHNVSWFNGATLNPCYNCLDRHLPERANQTAIIWEGDDPSESKKITYAELHEEVCRFSNVLRELKIKKGDHVCIYLPMIPEAVIAMLSCARIGAVHSVVFAGFSSNALKNRVIDAQCKLIITADENKRRGKTISLKKNVDAIINDCKSVEKIIVVKNSNAKIDFDSARDLWYHDAIEKVNAECEAIALSATDPLFILYTSGSTGKPKGILHSIGGYMVYTAMTFKWVFDYQDGDIYWCTADVGWITGHSYIVYGPLANGATTLIFAGTPRYPTTSRFWDIIDKHRVNIFYTAPTAIRALMREGDEPVKRTSRKSLKLLGTVGEPINPDVWQWYYDVVGDGRCPIVDTWWQTETGGIVLTPLPRITPLKPGAASWPFFGIVPTIMDDQGQKLEGEASGNLALSTPWPGMLETIYNDHDRFVKTYFSRYPGYYETGDGAKRDKDGYYWITGRVDDVINVSGHRFDTAEIESALVEHPKVSEAAVVGYPHPIKGQGIYAFVTPLANVAPDNVLKKELIERVRKMIGPIAKPDIIQFTNDLPKTRSGKIMRRILRKLVAGEFHTLGDTSTLANPEIIQTLKRKLKHISDIS